MATSDPTLKYIAERLNLSITTVSRLTLRAARKYRVSRKTEAAVLEVGRRNVDLRPTTCAGLAKQENAHDWARGAGRSPTHSSPKSPAPSSPKPVAAITSSSCATRRKTRRWRLPRSAACGPTAFDGLIVCPVGKSADHLKDLEEGGFPVILVDRCFPGLGMPYVATHNLFGGRQATEYLVANGHRRIGFVQGLPGTLPNNLRLAGYREILQEHRIPWDESLVVGDKLHGAKRLRGDQGPLAAGEGPDGDLRREHFGGAGGLAGTDRGGRGRPGAGVFDLFRRWRTIWHKSIRR